jgi:hypothetical protein
VSRPRFARRVRGHKALTVAFAPRLIIQLSGGCQLYSSTNRAPPRGEPLLMAPLRLILRNPKQSVDRTERVNSTLKP